MPSSDAAVRDELDHRPRVVHLEATRTARVRAAGTRREAAAPRPAAGPVGRADRQRSRRDRRAFRRQLVEHLLLEREERAAPHGRAEPASRRLDTPARPVEQLRPEALLEARTWSETAGG
jgi:hypothetical protein